jgi:hypothetical protein
LPGFTGQTKFEAMAKPKNPHAVALGKLGGSKGGKIRAAKLTPKQRSDIARKAVLARWERVKKSKETKIQNETS